MIAVAALALAALAGCAGGGRREVPTDFPWSRTGEMRIGHFYLAYSGQSRRDEFGYRVLYSKTWGEKRTSLIRDEFTEMAFPYTAAIEDDEMAKLLVAFDQEGFFGLPRRRTVQRSDVIPESLAEMPKKAPPSFVKSRKPDEAPLKHSFSALVVETDTVRAMVTMNDCRLDPQLAAYAKCLKAFEQVATANQPVQVYVGVEPAPPGGMFGPPGPVREPPPTGKQPKPLKLKPGVAPPPGDDAGPVPVEKPGPSAPIDDNDGVRIPSIPERIDLVRDLVKTAEKKPTNWLIARHQIDDLLKNHADDPAVVERRDELDELRRRIDARIPAALK